MARRPTTGSMKRARPAAAGSNTKQASAAAAGGVTIRHYCQGIGDCHLLQFPRRAGGDFFMLIDCGVHSSVPGGSETIAAIVADIAVVTKGRIDVLAVTHEHWDHVSGFLTAAEAFGKFEVGAVWLAWTENPRDRQARELDKYKGEAIAVLQLAHQQLHGLGTHTQLGAIGQGIGQMLGFVFGAAGEKVRDARNAAVNLAANHVVYHEPGAGPLQLEGVDGVNVYVLGPPRDAKLLGLTERASEMYGVDQTLSSPMGRALMTGFGMAAPDADGDADRDSPFDPEFGMKLADILPVAADTATKDARPIVSLLRDHYVGPAAVPGVVSRRQTSDPNRTDQSWRRVDGDWLAISADLALQLDNRTNNTSLVLAFEFAESKRVLLFAADAQVGNWLSWNDVTFGTGPDAVKGPDLLARTVYLKVGHHGSHNATLKAKGLERMTDPDLAAFIPVNEQDAKRIGWGQMPFRGILDDLASRTAGRVIRADDAWLREGRLPDIFAAPSGAVRGVRYDRSGEALWVELDIA